MSTNYVQRVEFEMQPDVYDGENCDQIRPRWWGYADGDMDGDYINKIELKPEHFPPGTRVVISLPECPECKQDVEMCKADDDCGFDWGEWVLNKYS